LRKRSFGALHTVTVKQNRRSTEIRYSSAKQQASRNFQKIVGVSAVAFPTVLRKQQRENTQKEVGGAEVLEIASGLSSCAAESPESAGLRTNKDFIEQFIESRR